MHELKRILCEEIKDIGRDVARDNKIGMSELQTLQALTDTLKNIHKIEMFEDDDGGYSGRRHYVRAHYSEAARDGYSERRDRLGRYARDGGRDETMRHLEAAMSAAGPEDREMLERMLNKMR